MSLRLHAGYLIQEAGGINPSQDQRRGHNWPKLTVRRRGWISYPSSLLSTPLQSFGRCPPTWKRSIFFTEFPDSNARLEAVAIAQWEEY